MDWRSARHAGPLIMVVTWVGYLGGVAKGAFAHPVAAGLGGAAVATFSPSCPPSFLPRRRSAGGGYARRTGATAPLTAITAAVVGVILNLAVFFACIPLAAGNGGRTFRRALMRFRSSSPWPRSWPCGNSRPTS
ncbi:MAG: hypothetical protein R3E40_07505 [Rhodocyclaceae bacterium]